MTDLDLTPLRAALAELAPHGRSALLPALHAAQRIYHCIREDAATEISRTLQVPLADVHGVIDFYEMFSREPTGAKVLRVCNSPVCAVAGADAVADRLCSYLKIAPGAVTANGEFSVEHAPCLGLCDQAPAILAGDVAVGKCDSRAAAAVCAGSPGGVSFVGGD